MKNYEEFTDEELEIAFLDAYTKVGKTKKKFPQDVLLHFYSYYKHATNDNKLRIVHQPETGEELVNAFKANALFQIKSISQRDAKISYIKLALQQLNGEF